jgi:hypothetical protein
MFWIFAVGLELNETTYIVRFFTVWEKLILSSLREIVAYGTKKI